MKWIITLLLMVFFTITNAQSRLGFSLDEISNEFSEYETVHKYNKNQDYSYSYLIVYLDDISSIYYFNDENICIKTVIIPENEVLLHYMIEDYNSKYVIVSSNKWKLYTKGMILNIELIWDEEFDRYYFLWNL